MKRSGPLKRKAPLRAKGGFARAEALSPERRREIASQAAVARWQLPAGPRAVMALARSFDAVTPIAKPETFHSEAWLAAVRSLPTCVRCRGGSLGIQAAHRNEGKGKGLKTHDCWTAAICPPCHFEIDQGKGLTRDSRRAEIDRCIVLTLAELVLAGRIGVIR